MSVDDKDFEILTGIKPTDPNRRIAVISFEGWLDAGAAASTATKYLAETLHLTPVESMDVSDHLDYQVKRPLVSRENGVREIVWPTIDVLAYVPDEAAEKRAKPKTSDDEIVFPTTVALDGSPVEEIMVVNGFEPAMKWQEFSQKFAAMLGTWDVDLVVSVRSVYSDVPHNRPVPVAKTSEFPAVREEFDAQQSEYEGPCGINTIVEDELEMVLIPTLNIIAQVPHYAEGTPWPKATVALLDAIEEALNIVIPRGELLDSSQFFVDCLNTAMEHNDHMAAYVEQLEEHHDQMASTKDTGDKLVEEFQNLLGGRFSGEFGAGSADLGDGHAAGSDAGDGAEAASETGNTDIDAASESGTSAAKADDFAEDAPDSTNAASESDDKDADADSDGDKTDK